MAITHIATSTVGQADDNPTTGNIDTTGADFLACIATQHPAGDPPSGLTDNKSNSWNARTLYGETRLYWSKPTSVGAGHNATYGGTFVLGSVVMIAFSGVASSPYESENGTTATSNSIQPGSVTPAGNGALIIQGISVAGAGTTLSINGGYATPVYEDANEDGVPGAGVSYLIQSTAAATNPTWTASQVDDLDALAAVFTAATGGLSPGAAALSLAGLGMVLGFKILMPDEL